jgi:uncharacterized membrane protein YdjX (TVP38/TMEM64 family)
MNEVIEPSRNLSSRRAWSKLLVAALFIAVITGSAFFLGDDQLSRLAQHELMLRQLRLEHPVLVYGVALFIYVLVTGLSIPAATALSLLYGWYFGFLRAVVVVSFGSTAGATLAFVTYRYLLRDLVQQRFEDRLRGFNREFEREGAFYLFTLRLLPVVPFFIVNALMGLTPIRIRTYWWVSQLGMLPGTLVWVYAGSVAPDLRTLAERGVQGLPMGKIAFSLTVLGLFPLVTRFIVRQFAKRPL